MYMTNYFYRSRNSLNYCRLILGYIYIKPLQYFLPNCLLVVRLGKFRFHIVFCRAYNWVYSVFLCSLMHNKHKNLWSFLVCAFPSAYKVFKWYIYFPTFRNDILFLAKWQLDHFCLKERNVANFDNNNYNTVFYLKLKLDMSQLFLN